MLPRWGGYRIRQELIQLEDQNAKVHRLVKVPLAELEKWDAEHDVLGLKTFPVVVVGDGSEEDHPHKA